MKRILLVSSLLVFYLGLFAKENCDCLTNEVDTLSGDTVKISEFKRIYYKFDESAIVVNGEIRNNIKYLNIFIEGPELFAMDEDKEIIFYTVDGNIIRLKNLKWILANHDNITPFMAKYNATLSFPLEDRGTINLLSYSKINKIRVNFYNGYIEEEIKPPLQHYVAEVVNCLFPKELVAEK